MPELTRLQKLERFAVLDAASADEYVLGLALSAAEAALEKAGAPDASDSDPLWELCLMQLATYYHDARGAQGTEYPEFPPYVTDAVNQIKYTRAAAAWAAAHAGEGSA